MNRVEPNNGLFELGSARLKIEVFELEFEHFFLFVFGSFVSGRNSSSVRVWLVSNVRHVRFNSARLVLQENFLDLDLEALTILVFQIRILKQRGRRKKGGKGKK